jgi:hypothetical protein
MNADNLASSSIEFVRRLEQTDGGMIAAISAIVDSEITPGPLDIFATNPTASAPCRTASFASATLHIQQILTLGRSVGSKDCSTWVMMLGLVRWRIDTSTFYRTRIAK